MMLLQSVVNSVVVFVSLSIRVALGNRQNGRRGDSALGYLLESVARVVLTLLGTLVCAYFSRRRDSMIRALQRLGQMRPTPLPGTCGRSASAEAWAPCSRGTRRSRSASTRSVRESSGWCGPSYARLGANAPEAVVDSGELWA